MAAQKLADGSVVARPAGKRAYPTGGGTSVRTPSVAAGAGSGKGGRAAAVRGKQPGRGAVPVNAYR